MMSSQLPSAPPLIPGVIYVTPVSSWNQLEPPPPYSEFPDTPVHYPNQTIARIRPLEPGYRHVSPVDIHRATMTSPVENHDHQTHSSIRPLEPGYGQVTPVDLNHAAATHRAIGSGRENWKSRRKAQKKYVLSNFAVMKLVEFVSCVIGIAACITLRLELGLEAVSVGRSGFFIIVQGISLLVVLIVLCMNLTGRVNGIDNEAGFFKIIIIHIMCGCMNMVSSSLLADIRVKYLCATEDAVCLAFKIAMGGGFLTTIFFWVDAALHTAALKAIKLHALRIQRQ